jgi:cold shock CspA family protein
VGQGEVVEVVRKDFAGEKGFAFIRTANNIEGFVRSEYIQSVSSREISVPFIIQETNLVHETHINQDSQFSAAAQLHTASNAEESHIVEIKSGICEQVQPSQPFDQSKKDSNLDGKTNGSNKTTTKTNKRPSHHLNEKLTKTSKPESVEAVEAAPAPEEAKFAINSPMRHVNQGADSSMRHVINRRDGEETTRLRNCPDGSSRNGVWVKGNASVGQGEVVEVVRKDFAGEKGFAFIRTANNIEGFVRSEYIQSSMSEHQKSLAIDHQFPSTQNKLISSSCIPLDSMETSESIGSFQTQVGTNSETLFSCCDYFDFFQNPIVAECHLPTRSRMGLLKSKQSKL